jgi:hypothetical protein
MVLGVRVGTAGRCCGGVVKMTPEAVRISMLRVQYCKKKPVIPGYPLKTIPDGTQYL